MYEKKKKLLARLEEQLVRLEVQATDKVSQDSVCVCACMCMHVRIGYCCCLEFVFGFFVVVFFFCFPLFMEVVHMFPGEKLAICSSPATWAATFHLQGLILCVLYFPVSRQWYGCQCLGFLTYTQMLLQAVHWGCTKHQRESALRKISEKNPLPHWGVKPASAARWTWCSSNWGTSPSCYFFSIVDAKSEVIITPVQQLQ